MAVAPSQRRRVVAIAGLVIAAAVAGFLVALLVVGEPATTIESAGPTATQVRGVARFQAVDLVGSAEVSVDVGAEQSVVVRAGKSLLRRVTTRVSDGTLVIGTTGGFESGQRVRVDVHVPTLDALTLHGSGVVVAGNLGGRRVTIALPGSGLVRATGAVSTLDVKLGGSGDAQLGRLAAEDVHALLSGSGRIVVQARRSLDASVTGSGAIMYHGAPRRISRNVSGTGAIISG